MMLQLGLFVAGFSLFIAGFVMLCLEHQIGAAMMVSSTFFAVAAVAIE
jgi:hypothetical protein